MVRTEIAIIKITIKTMNKVFMLVFTVKKFKTPFISKTAIGRDIIQANNTSLMYCFVNRIIIVETLAPNAFLIPISFVFLRVVYIARPNNPRHEIRIPKPHK